LSSSPKNYTVRGYKFFQGKTLVTVLIVSYRRVFTHEWSKESAGKTKGSMNLKRESVRVAGAVLERIFSAAAYQFHCAGPK